MEHLLCCLSDALGVELNVDESALQVDDELIVHFEESERGLEMICPLGELPTDTARLQRVLKMNYVGPLVLAADADGVALLALVRMPDGSSGDELVAALEGLIQTARGIKEELYF
ncbi:CesT family type III secretion system chaperone [Pseudomonas chlororaphis subsp. aurantiaca]|uniref:CesT family type III secretion system chaperone n=1 Tax=Pseudomonas chlororaphis TaxID=587753 RepID=UPI0027DCDFBD|nr:CesT family type III secretion system chaperone [Pseudomonas chlororaphis]WMI97583.1 CesT family type III secretion system chaperone [Pseudomonas chlororaphis subsp. aurantiaca]